MSNSLKVHTMNYRFFLALTLLGITILNKNINDHFYLLIIYDL